MNWDKNKLYEFFNEEQPQWFRSIKAIFEITLVVVTVFLSCRTLELTELYGESYQKIENMDSLIGLQEQNLLLLNNLVFKLDTQIDNSYVLIEELYEMNKHLQHSNSKADQSLKLLGAQFLEDIQSKKPILEIDSIRVLVKSKINRKFLSVFINNSGLRKAYIDSTRVFFFDSSYQKIQNIWVTGKNLKDNYWVAPNGRKEISQEIYSEDIKNIVASYNYLLIVVHWRDERMKTSTFKSRCYKIKYYDKTEVLEYNSFLEGSNLCENLENAVRRYYN